MAIDNYQSIFTKRAQSYHQAMLDCPNARNQEYLQLLKKITIRSTDNILDLPSGGCYFQKFILPHQVFCCDPSHDFLLKCSNKGHVIEAEIERIPFKSFSFDKIFSLAGIHHIENKSPIFFEVFRLLKVNGLFRLADVKQGSKEDDFLNIFVNQYNSMGHHGVFLNHNTHKLLINTNFNIIESGYFDFHWNFKNEAEMINFVKNLFGLDLASNDDILYALKETLGYETRSYETRRYEKRKYETKPNTIKLSWGLQYISAKKSSSSS